MEEVKRPPAAASLPRTLYLETTNRCDSKCQTCVRTFVTLEPPRDLTLAEVERIVDQFPRLDRVVLHGIGEPLLNRELFEIIGCLKARGATVLFNSDAITLTPERASRLIETGLDEYRVSIDAASRETYRVVRGVDPACVSPARGPAGSSGGLRAAHGLPRARARRSRAVAPPRPAGARGTRDPAGAGAGARARDRLEGVGPASAPGKPRRHGDRRAPLGRLPAAVDAELRHRGQRPHRGLRGHLERRALPAVPGGLRERDRPRSVPGCGLLWSI
jgi:hypothetical protein